MVRNITKTLCTLAPMMERSFDMFCLSTKKLYRTNVFVFIALYRTPKLPGQFCQEEEDMKITHLSMFTNWRGVSQTTLVWIDMTGSRFPFFLMLAITQCTVMVIEAQHWFRAGARLHYSGSISRALKQWSMKLTVLPPLCIETERQLMCHSLLVNSNLKSQFKGRTDLNTTSPEKNLTHKDWKCELISMSLFSIIEKRGLLHPFL